MTTMSTKPSTAKIIKLSVGSYTILNEYTGENATKHRGSQCMSPLRDRLRYGHFGSSINPHMWKCTTSWTKGSCDIPRRKFWFPCSQNLAWHWPLVPVICTVVFIMSPMINASTNQSIRDIAWGSTTSVRPGDRIFMRTRHETPDTQVILSFGHYSLTIGHYSVILWDPFDTNLSFSFTNQLIIFCCYLLNYIGA